MDALRDLAGFFKHVRRGGKRGILVCPKCGSRNITSSDTKYVGWFLPQAYVCTNCKYRGSIVVEIENVEEQPATT